MAAQRKVKAPAIDINTADAFWDSLHTTYSDSRYCNVADLPRALQDAVLSQDGLEVECSSYTVGEHAAFLRGSVMVGDEEFEFEVSLGSLEGGAERDDDGNLVDSNGQPVEDEDEYFDGQAQAVYECMTCDGPGGLSAYFRR